MGSILHQMNTPQIRAKAMGIQPLVRSSRLNLPTDQEWPIRACGRIFTFHTVGLADKSEFIHPLARSEIISECDG
jgi:hypothetical protein